MASSKTKILSLILSVIMLLSVLTVLSSCTKKPYEYDLDKYITLPEKWEHYSVSDSDIERRASENIETVRKNSIIESVLTDRSSVSGDRIALSLVCYPAATYGTKDSTQITDLTDSDCSLIIGNGKYPTELEKALVGLHANDKATVRLTLPENFTLKSLAGTAVVYEVTVKEVYQLQLPLYNDAFVRSVSACNNIDEYEKEMHKRAEQELLWEKIVGESIVISYPEAEIRNYTNSFITHYTSLAGARNETLETYVARKYFTELTDFHLQADAHAKKIVKEELVLYKFVRKFELEINASEYQTGAERYAKEYGLRSVAALEGKYGTAFVRQSVQSDKVLEFIVSEIARIAESPSPEHTPT